VNRVLGQQTGQGFYQMMDGVEVGRVNVAARACGVAQRAFEIERLYRDAPMLLIGEGTAEIQKMIIGRRLLERYAL
jgi:alkylation response protein AidB-like acyl-CoA dehydrogenase